MVSIRVIFINLQEEYVKNNIVFTGGGSGGHVYPGLAIIEKLRAKTNAPIMWIGSNKGIERNIVSEWGIPFIAIPSGKLRRYISIKNFIDIGSIILGVVLAFILFVCKRPALLFSKGGYVAVPPVLAASLLKIPVVSHESDLDPGLATKINAIFSKKILVAYMESAEFFPQKYAHKIEVTGNPVRSAIYDADPEKGRNVIGYRGKKPILLVLGGSQGARQINQLIRKYIDRLCRICFVVHQYGSTEVTMPSKPDYFARSYFHDEYAHILSSADLVVSRSGAGSLWEIGALSKAALLVPLEGSGSRGDQVRNAHYFKDRNAAAVFFGSAQTEVEFLQTIETLMADNKKLGDLGASAGRLCPKQASDRISDIILSTLEDKYESLGN
jgi:UDP-N-acetylglucosamine--N-acetylmuramyl-(pentapeptide) pyrophosphoryl-undecaprenol N-acetylglucosamine transferase